MPTAVDVADELPEVVAWIGAWEDPESRTTGRDTCIRILNDTWQFLFGDEKVPKQKTMAPEMLKQQLRSLRGILQKWDEYDEGERSAHLRTARNILASAVAFFA